MNFKMMGRFIAQILSIEGVFMLPALAISLYCRETAAAWGFFYTPSMERICAIKRPIILKFIRGLLMQRYR